MSSTLAPQKERCYEVEEDALAARGREALLRAIELHEFEVQRLELALTERKARMANLRAAVDALEPDYAVDNSDDADFPLGFGRRMRERKTSVAWQVRREAFLYIKDVGRPVRREELYQYLRTRIDFKTENPLGALSQIMSRAKEFKKFEGGYWLAGS